MNTSFDRHFAYQDWEEYALGRRSEEDCTPLEEHLLICHACQDLLAEADAYIQAAKAAAALLAPLDGQGKPVTDTRTRRKLSKRAAAAATLA
jgi:hypothetical protein